VKRLSGFKAIYGPVKASDLLSFLDSGGKATPEMRLKTFTLWERIVLIPLELVAALKVGLISMAILFLLSLLGRSEQGWTSALDHGLFSVLAVLTAVLAGAVLTPLLLPWLPGRAFSLKGLSMGLVAGVIILFLCFNNLAHWTGRLEVLAWLLLIPALSAYLGMNFTGASTYTSLSGVRKEMRWALPLEIGAGIVGIVLWLGSQFFA
jgi:hypothetical protein